MAYQIKLDDNQLTLVLKGTVDLSETSEIKEAIKSEPKAEFKKLAIEGSELDYIDSSAVALLLFSKKIAEENGLTFEILSLSDSANKVINLAGLTGVLKTKESKTSQNTKLESTPDDLDISLDNLFD
jgi:anti-sigma B factor antagonist